LPTVTCDAKFGYHVIEDARKETQSFDVVVRPNAMFSLYLGSSWETFTATVTAPDGGRRTLITGPKGGKRTSVIGNTGTTSQKYRVAITRSAAAKTWFEADCLPIVASPQPSGLGDDAACIADAPCVKSTPSGPLPATCSGITHENLGDPTHGAAALGRCY
jgi:hypothetical protein